jgi:23S rRNA (uracil1939-C5)-methyltransferase
MVHGGGCLARTDDGERILVDGAIPGELVDAELARRRGGVWWARVTAVVEASPHRVVPPCPYVPECGGCDLQHVAYPHQLELKRAIVSDALRRHGVEVDGDLTVHGMSDPWRYRSRGEFHVVPGRAGVADAGLGFNRARSWQPLAVEDCLIHHRAITDSLPALRDAVRRGATSDLQVLHLTVGDGGDELLVGPRPAQALPVHLLDDAAHGDGLPRWITEATTLRWRGHSFRVRSDTFVQVNPAQMDVLYGLVLDRLGSIDGSTVVDAYAGIGVLSVAVAERAAAVICVEANRVAAQLGVLNARINGADDRVSYMARPVEAALPEIAARSPIDAVILDPPRAGCSGSVTGWLALAGPATIVYVSCDPATLARDLRLLAVSGPYVLESLDVVDMFPQTHHVESVAALRRRD